MIDTSGTSESTHEEMLAKWRACEEAREREALEGATSQIDRFRKLAASRGVILGSDAFRYMHKIGVIAEAPSLAKTLLKGILMDKDDLYRFDDIARQLPTVRRREGCFNGDDFVVMAHPCFRRGMNPGNNWAPRFIELFWSFSEPGVEKFVAIDSDRVRIDIDGPDCLEMDTWFGAHFNEDVMAIPAGIVKLRPPLDMGSPVVNLFFAECHCLDIKWSDQENVKSFQALEFKTENVQIEIDGISYFPARYLHAEFDGNLGAFRHFDGAVQYLLAEEYYRRRDGDFNIRSKDKRHIKARSQKVFKLNGPLLTEQWVELCCHFLAGNPLTFEYFTGSYPNHVNDAINRMRSRSEQTTDA